MNLEYKQEEKIFLTLFALHLVFSTARKSFIYGLFLDFSSYSNSRADRIIQVLFSTLLCRFVFIFSEFYLIFFSCQIIRAKIEPSQFLFLFPSQLKYYLKIQMSKMLICVSFNDTTFLVLILSSFSI